MHAGLKRRQSSQPQRVVSIKPSAVSSIHGPSPRPSALVQSDVAERPRELGAHMQRLQTLTPLSMSWQHVRVRKCVRMRNAPTSLRARSDIDIDFGILVLVHVRNEHSPEWAAREHEDIDAHA